MFLTDYTLSTVEEAGSRFALGPGQQGFLKGQRDLSKEEAGQAPWRVARPGGRNHSAQQGPRRSGTLVTWGLIKMPKRKVPVLTNSIPAHRDLGDHGT